MAQTIDYQSAPPEAVEADLGQRLAALRLSRNLSQAALAAEAGVSRRTITRMEHGAGISLDTLIRVMRALGAAEHLQALLPDPQIRPVERVRLRGRQRSRAGRADEPSAWTWDTDAHER